MFATSHVNYTISNFQIPERELQGLFLDVMSRLEGHVNLLLPIKTKNARSMRQVQCYSSPDFES